MNCPKCKAKVTVVSDGHDCMSFFRPIHGPAKKGEDPCHMCGSAMAVPEAGREVSVSVLKD